MMEMAGLSRMSSVIGLKVRPSTATVLPRTSPPTACTTFGVDNASLRRGLESGGTPTELLLSRQRTFDCTAGPITLDTANSTATQLINSERFDGLASLRLDATNTPSSIAFRSAAVTVTPSTTYTAGAFVKAATTSRNTRAFVEWYDTSGGLIATRVYGAAAVEYAPGALKDLEKVKQLGLEGLPVCIAKTQSSLSDQPGLRGRPRDFVATVREVEIASGARFLVPITGNMMRMPGLPEVPSAEKIDIDEKGVISGLF